MIIGHAIALLSKRRSNKNLVLTNIVVFKSDADDALCNALADLESDDDFFVMASTVTPIVYTTEDKTSTSFG